LRKPNFYDGSGSQPLFKGSCGCWNKWGVKEGDKGCEQRRKNEKGERRIEKRNRKQEELKSETKGVHYTKKVGTKERE